MDIEKAKILLESLIGRIERDAGDGNWRLVGVISPQERDALRFVLQYIGVELGPDVHPAASPKPIEAPAFLPEVSLNTHSASLQTAEDQEVLMCIDFGTAMSKAFAIHAADEVPIDLALGTRAGYTEAVYPVPSAVFISDNGRVFLGHEAIGRSLEDTTPGRERFDSPKQELSQGTMADLASVSVPTSINPSGVPLTKEDLITLYLAYVTDLAGTELAERHHRSRHIRRRFARPCWDAERTKWAEHQLKRMLARAQILADTFTGEWSGGIDVRRVRAALNHLDAVVAPSFLVAEGVAEPVAAASSLVIRGEPQRRGFMVVDVGAGTTDFGMFVAVERAGLNGPRIFQVPGSIRGIRQAGDTIDRFLRATILRAHNVDLQSAYGQRLSVELNLRVRQFKERLFRDGSLKYNLADDTEGEITLEQFLEREEMARFKSALEQELRKTVESIDTTWLEGIFGKQGLMVVLTGGGSSLPMVQTLAKCTIESRGISMQCTASPQIPPWIAEGYRQFIPEYSQLAVAMGGASPTLPEMGPEIAHFGGGITAPTYTAGNLQLKGT